MMGRLTVEIKTPQGNLRREKVVELRSYFQRTGAIPEGPWNLKPRTPMMSGDLPARNSYIMFAIIT